MCMATTAGGIRVVCEVRDGYVGGMYGDVKGYMCTFPLFVMCLLVFVVCFLVFTYAHPHVPPQPPHIPLAYPSLPSHTPSYTHNGG